MDESDLFVLFSWPLSLLIMTQTFFYIVFLNFKSCKDDSGLFVLFSWPLDLFCFVFMVFKSSKDD